MRKLVAVLMAVLMVVGLFVGCASQTAPLAEDSNTPGNTQANTPGNDADPDEKIKIGFAVYNFTNPFYFSMMEGGDAAAEEFGAEVIWKSCEGSIEEEIAIIENFIEQGVDLICMDPVDAKALEDVIDKAADEGIPVVSILNVIDANCYSFSPDNIKTGNKIGQVLAHSIGKAGKVAILQEQPGNNSSDGNEQGVREALAMYPDIEIVGEQVTNFDPDKAFQITETWMSSLPELDAIVTISGTSAAAATQAIKAAGRQDEIAVFSIDGQNGAAVADGTQCADSVSIAFPVGYYGIKISTEIVKDPNSWPRVIYFTSPAVASQETIDKLEAEGFAKDAPEVELLEISEAMKLVDNDPTKIPLTFQ